LKARIMERDFATQAKSVVDDILKDDPITATWAGVHRYDADMPDVSEEGFSHRQTAAKKHAADLRRWEPEQLPPQERIDWHMLCSRFEVQVRETDELEPHKHDPSLYPNIAMSGVYSLLARDYAPLADRLPALESRLKQVPDVFAAARRNLERSPKIWTDIALEETAGAAAFLHDTVGAVSDEHPRLRSALDAALAACEEYRSFLSEEHAHRNGMPFAIGRELFDFKLRREHLLDMDCAALLAFGEQAMAQTQAQLIETAERIEPGRSWAQLVETFSRELPPEDSLMEHYRRGVADTRQFVVDRGLVSIPKGESLQVVETPTFMRPTIPYAAYMPAGAFDARQEGLYYVTPVNQDLPLAERREQMLGHNRFGMLLTNVHEGYPGHHLQLVLSNGVESPVRKVLSNTVFCEGWALYCEQLMLDEGLTDDARVRLFQLKDQMWRACRVVIDVKLSTGAMTFEQAVDMLVNEAHLERPNAVGEVRRYTQSPTQPMSYLVGKHQIMQLREREKSRLNHAFDLRSFHDRLLSYGTIPVALIEPTFWR